MANAALLLFVTLVTGGWPFYEAFVDWPEFQRALAGDAARARRHAYRTTMALQWTLTVAGSGLWLATGEPLSAVGLLPPTGPRLWASAIAVLLVGWLYARQVSLLARSAEARRRVRGALTSLESLLPHTRGELAWFVGTSITAGICEEFLYRGLILSAVAPVIGWWPAALLSVVGFGLLHAYQGRRGIVRTALVGLAMTGVVVGARSLIPAMLLHLGMDIGGGLAAWVAIDPRRQLA